MFDYLANPARFKRIAAIITPIAWAVFIIALAFGLYHAFIKSPADYQQGETVRIMYIHVPSAWLALLTYLTMAIMAFFYLVYKHPLADIAARAMAPLGAGFALITLISGSLWGQPTWGTWWVWDARLTSVLILFFLYIGYIVLADSFDNTERGSKTASVLLILGVINIPIIKFSVDWWNTLHQGASVFRSGGPLIHPSMLTPLFLMTIALSAWLIIITIMRIQTILMQRHIRAAKNKQIKGL